MNKTKLFKILRFLLGVIITVFALIYLSYIIRDKLSTINFTDVVYLIDDHKLNILLVIFLMPINWGIEIHKWRSLTMKFQKITFDQGVKSILAGILLGLFTPNRLGELGGRVLYIEKQNRTKALYVNSVCSISQFLITVLFGFIALQVFHEQINQYINFPRIYIGLTVSLISVVLIWIYFRSQSIKQLFNFFGRKVSTKQEIDEFYLSIVDRFKLLIYSFLRYLVFSIQFTILLLAFIPSLELGFAFMAIALIFFGATLVPTTWLSSLPVKTSFAYFVIEYLGYQGMYGLIASLFLWMINLLIPALMGLIVLSKIKFQEVK